MGGKTKRKAGSRKDTGNAERKEPFALVFYKKDGTKGVIQSKDLAKKNRKVGVTCSVPNPIDYADIGCKVAKTLHEAKIVEFGDNIDFLYELPMRQDGTIDFGIPNNLSQPERKKYTEIKALKDQSVLMVDNTVVKTVSLFDSGPGPSHTVQKSVVPSDDESKSFSSEKTVELDHMGAADGTQNDLERESIADKNITYSSVDKDTVTIELGVSNLSENDVEVSTHSGSADEQRVPGALTNDTADLTSTTGSEQNLRSVLSSASQENMLFLKSLATGNNLEFLKKICVAMTSTSVDQNVPVTAPIRQNHNPQIQQHETKNLKFENFECAHGEGKFPLVKGMAVFLEKSAYCCIPKLIPVTISEDPPQTGFSDRNVREVVNDIVDKIVPKEIKPTVTARTLPKEIVKAIEAYINIRMLQEEQRVDAVKIKGYISDRCRQARPRNRAEEKIKRDEAKANGTFKPRKPQQKT